VSRETRRGSLSLAHTGLTSEHASGVQAPQRGPESVASGMKAPQPEGLLGNQLRVERSDTRSCDVIQRSHPEGVRGRFGHCLMHG
jgi:hypothetical protein